MAGDWVPWCKGLAKKPEVLAIAKATGRTRKDIACTLMEFWEWADDISSDGTLPGVSLEQLCEIVPDTNLAFFSALKNEHWLQEKNNELRIPNFKFWMGKSAKKRLKSAIRQRLRRGKKSRSQRDKSVTTGQDRTGQHTNVCILPDKPAEKKPKKERKPRKPREPDPLWDAVVELTATDSTVSASHIGKICSLLRAAEPPYTPDELRRLPAALAARKWDFPITLPVIEKYIGLVRNTTASPPPQESPESKRHREDMESMRKYRESCEPKPTATPTTTPPETAIPF